ncbi:hypothetical protein KI387_004545, partial [Taxus chinensis]
SFTKNPSFMNLNGPLFHSWHLGGNVSGFSELNYEPSNNQDVREGHLFENFSM